MTAARPLRLSQHEQPSAWLRRLAFSRVLLICGLDRPTLRTWVRHQCSCENLLLGQGLGTPAVVNTHGSVAATMEAILRVLGAESATLPQAALWGESSRCRSPYPRSSSPEIRL